MSTAVASAVSVRLFGDRVLIRPVDAPDMHGGLYVPEVAKEKPQQGEVVAVGPGALSDKGERVPVEVAVGERVLYGKYSGTEVVLDGDEFLVLREADLLLVVEPDTTG